MGERLYRSWKANQSRLYIEWRKGCVREHNTSHKSETFDESANRLHWQGNVAAIPWEITRHKNRADAKVTSQDFAGEGIEYNWGCSKGCYPRLPMWDKRLKTKFRESVRKCIDRDEVLVIGHCRLFSKRAREYMLAYSILDNSDELGITHGAEEENKPHMTAYLIEKIVKQYKSHQSASDFDTGFINRTIQAMKNNQPLSSIMNNWRNQWHQWQ